MIPSIVSVVDIVDVVISSPNITARAELKLLMVCTAELISIPLVFQAKNPITSPEIKIMRTPKLL